MGILESVKDNYKPLSLALAIVIVLTIILLAWKGSENMVDMTTTPTTIGGSAKNRNYHEQTHNDHINEQESRQTVNSTGYNITKTHTPQPDPTANVDAELPSTAVSEVEVGIVTEGSRNNGRSPNLSVTSPMVQVETSHTPDEKANWADQQFGFATSIEDIGDADQTATDWLNEHPSWNNHWM